MPMAFRILLGIGFMTFRLRNQLQQEGEYEIGEGVDSFVALAKYLDGLS